MSDDPEASPPIVGLVLCDDLIFSSRILGTARALGFVFQAVRDPETLKAKLESISPRCIILDLGNESLDLAEFFTFLRDRDMTLRVVAYGSHVDTARLSAARAAGCEPVLARSKFVDELARLIPEWLTA
jgi:CheY-like chemotaxis protein